MRKSTTMKPIVWQKPSFRSWSAPARFVFIFLTTGPETNLSGLVRYPISEISESTGLPTAKVRAALQELSDAKRVLWDESFNLILILRWIKHNPLNNSKLESGALNQIAAYENHDFHRIAISLINGADPDRVSIGYLEGIDTSQGQGQGQGQGKDGGDARGGQNKIAEMTDAVLAYLREVTGRKFENGENIRACLVREKCTVSDCKEVIDYKWGEWGGTVMAGNVDNVVLWRKCHFKNYLDQAKAGPPKAVTGKGQESVTEKNLRFLREREERCRNSTLQEP